LLELTPQPVTGTLWVYLPSWEAWTQGELTPHTVVGRLWRFGGEGQGRWLARGARGGTGWAWAGRGLAARKPGGAASPSEPQRASKRA
jgi:hypothetical protein